MGLLCRLVAKYGKKYASQASGQGAMSPKGQRAVAQNSDTSKPLYFVCMTVAISYTYVLSLFHSCLVYFDSMISHQEIVSKYNQLEFILDKHG